MMRNKIPFECRIGCSEMKGSNAIMSMGMGEEFRKQWAKDFVNFLCLVGKIEERLFVSHNYTLFAFLAHSQVTLPIYEGGKVCTCSMFIN